MLMDRMKSKILIKKSRLFQKKERTSFNSLYKNKNKQNRKKYKKTYATNKCNTKKIIGKLSTKVRLKNVLKPIKKTKFR